MLIKESNVNYVNIIMLFSSSGSGSGSYFTILPGSTVHSLPSPSSSSSSASTSLFETF